MTNNFFQRVHASFSQQTIMTTIGAQLVQVDAGVAEIHLPFRADLCQQNGFIHAGIVTTIVDSACGYAAYSLMPEDAGVLTIEFKVNFMRPAIGEYLRAIGRVERAGQTITVCRGEVQAFHEGMFKPIALMQATVMTVRR